MANSSDSIIQEALKTIADWFASILSKVSDYLWRNFQPVFEKISNWINTVFNSLENVAKSIQTWISGTINNIESFIQNAFRSVSDFMGQLYDKLAASITNVFDKTVGYFSDLYDTITNQITTAYQQVADSVSGIYNAVVQKVQGIAANVSGYLSSLYNGIRSAVGNVIDQATTVVNAIYDAIKRFISSVIDTVGSTLHDLMTTVAQLPDTITKLGSDFADAVEKFIGQPLGSISEDLWKKLNEYLITWGEGTFGTENSGPQYVLGQTQTAPKSRAEWEQFFTRTIPQGGTAAVLFNLIVGIYMVLQVGSGVAQANAQIVLQEYGEQYAYNIPSVPDTTQMYWRDLIDQPTAIKQIKQQGYTEQDAVKLLDMIVQQPDPSTAIMWLNRGEINDAQFKDYLHHQGYSDDVITHYLNTRFFIPPVQDLITMAVRESFSPEIATTFGQYEQYPDAVTPYLEQQGVSEFWAKAYWAAHWNLPSPQMGFEMYQKRIITYDELTLLLEALDVMPFWRDKIIQMAYIPLARVDVRRIHKLGLMTQEQVNNAYLDIGYSPENAAILTQFTVESNNPGTVDVPTELTTLSRTLVETYYKDGLLTRDEAITELVNLNYSQFAAELYISAIDLQVQSQERTDAANLELNKLKAGLVTFDQFQGDLARLQLQSVEYDRYVTQGVQIVTSKTTLPSKADLDKFHKSAIIDDTEYLVSMGLLGYSPVWAERYLTLIKGV